MAKKSAKKKPKTPVRSGELYGVRCSEDDAADFEKAAYLEGFTTVQQWLLAIGRKRSRAILHAAAKSDAVSVTDVIVTTESK